MAENENVTDKLDKVITEENWNLIFPGFSLCGVLFLLAGIGI